MNDINQKNDPKTQLVVRYLLDQACFPQGARILQIGCRDGEVLSQILETRPDLHCSGVDINEAFITSARSRLPAGRFAVAQANEELTLRGPFDCIFSYGIAQKFLPLQFVELNERLSRCLLPQGVLQHFAIPNAKQSFQYIMHKWQRRQGNTLGALIGGFDGVISKWTKKYDETSYWHDPEIMQSSLRHLGAVQLRIPASAWYKFDIKILP